MTKIHIPKKENLTQATIPIPLSKSILNRMLIITALSDKKLTKQIEVSDSEDAIDMKRCLLSSEQTINSGHGGTTYRFLLSYYALKTEKEIILEASEQMTKRPIGVLVNILNKLGAKIEYLGIDGFPPVLIKPSNLDPPDILTIPADTSSQFISSVLLVSPYLGKEITIKTGKKTVSQPYIDLTIDMMMANGAKIKPSISEKAYTIKPSEYDVPEIRIESDWSAASYFIGMTIGTGGDYSMTLEGLNPHSVQADRVILEIGTLFGLEYSWEPDQNLILACQKNFTDPIEVFIDFTRSPDIAQTVMVIAALRKVNMKFTGVQTLFIKETNRMKAMTDELAKINCHITKLNETTYYLDTSKRKTTEVPIEFNTYGDHRMAMSLSLLCLIQDVIINDKQVVSKSYVDYWEHLSLLGG